MLDMIKTYKPKKSKKIVRRQGGGGKLGKVLGLGGGYKAGEFVAEHPIPPYLPEEVTKRLGPIKSTVAEIAIEGTALAGAGKGAKKALQTKYMNDLTKKLGIGVLKKVLTGGLGGPIGLGYAAHGLYDMGKPFFDEEVAHSKGYKSSKKLREDYLKRLGKRRKETHRKGSAKYKKEHSHLFDAKGKYKGMLAGRKRKRTRNFGSRLVAKGYKNG
jgi:hypothetical protein